MSTARNEELDRLLNELVDSTLTEVDERRLEAMLRGDASARRQYREFMALHADLHWDYAAAAISPPERSGQAEHARQRTKWNISTAWAAAALLLILATGVFLSTGNRWGDVVDEQPVIGQITPMAGDIQLGYGATMQAISQETELRAGVNIHVVGLASLAELRLDDGTEISLAGETRIDCFRQDGQTSLALREGYLSANVTQQATECPLVIHTPGAEMQVLGTRLAVSADDEISELGVRHGQVLLKRLTDGETVDVFSGQYAVVSQRVELETKPWPETPEIWSEDFEDGLPAGWRYGQWLRAGDSRGVVRAARRFAMDGSQSHLHRITLPKRWMEGLWRLHEDTVLHFTYKMNRPGWFHIMMGVRSDDLNASHVGNYELQSNFWKKAEPDQWQTVSVPLSAFRKNVRGVPYTSLPAGSPSAGDVVYLLWFNTGDVDRGLVIDRIWVDRGSQPSEDSP